MQGIAKLSVALLALVPLSCDSDPLLPLQTHPIVTDSRVYEARPIDPPGPNQRFQLTLVARFQNQGDRTLYLDRCNPDSPHPIYGFRAVDFPELEVAWSYVCAGVGHDRDFRIPPRAMRTDTLRIVGPSLFTFLGEPIGVLEGEFQLVYRVLDCPGDECWDQRAPDSLGVSNSFTVRLEG